MALGFCGAPLKGLRRRTASGRHDQDEAFTDEFFAGFTKSPTGLEYKIVQEGYVSPSGQGIKANYAGYLLRGAKFDSSYDRRKPLGFTQARGA